MTACAVGWQSPPFLGYTSLPMHEKCQVILKPREDRRLLRGHLWAYRNEFAVMPKLPDGAVVDVVSETGRLVGRGFYQSEGGIAVRILARKSVDVDADFFLHRIVRALRFRQRLFPGQTSYRWIHGESDGLPGLMADRYGGLVSAQTSCSFYRQRADELAQAFLAQDGVTGVRLQAGSETVRFGEVPAELTAEIDGLVLTADLEGGQKTGLFLDQRWNSQRLAAFAPGARVLDAHCYVGLWSCRLALQGAASVFGVDSSQQAIDHARRNAERNGVGDRCAFERADVSETLQRGDRYDIVLLDPPALAKGRGSAAKALGLYQSLNRDAMAAVEPGGFLVTSSCSHAVDLDSFFEAIKRAARALQRDVWILETRGAAPDHPVLAAMPETAYLKTMMLRVF